MEYIVLICKCIGLLGNKCTVLFILMNKTDYDDLLYRLLQTVVHSCFGNMFVHEKKHGYLLGLPIYVGR